MAQNALAKKERDRMTEVIIRAPAEITLNPLEAASIADLMRKFFRDPANEAAYQAWLAEQEGGEAECTG